MQGGVIGLGCAAGDMPRRRMRASQLSVRRDASAAGAPSDFITRFRRQYGFAGNILSARRFGLGGHAGSAGA